MNFEVNDVTAKILDDFQDTIDNALGDVKDNQEKHQKLLDDLQNQMEKIALQSDLKVLEEEIKKNQKQIEILQKSIESLNENIDIIKTQLGTNESLLKRIALRPHRLR